MIHTAKITKGFATKLPAFERTYEFMPGLNILFGPNACGKTTLVNILGAYSGTEAGWSHFLAPTIRQLDEKPEFPALFATISPGLCEAEVDWDGTASFLMSPQTGHAFGGMFEDSKDGLIKSDELLMEMMGKPSEGQSIIWRLGKFFKNLKNTPDLTERPPSYTGVNDIWQESMRSFANYVKTLPRKGPTTLLLDEVDRSLSIPNQVQLWLEILPKVAINFQVIIATHCEFALAHRSCLIEMVPCYVEQCLEWISKARVAPIV